MSNGQQEIQVIEFYVIKLWCNLLGSSKSIEAYVLFNSLNGLIWIVRQILQGGFIVGFLRHWWLEVLRLDNSKLFFIVLMGLPSFLSWCKLVSMAMGIISIFIWSIILILSFS